MSTPPDVPLWIVSLFLQEILVMLFQVKPSSFPKGCLLTR